jgi:hypothetical protein
LLQAGLPAVGGELLAEVRMRHHRSVILPVAVAKPTGAASSALASDRRHRRRAEEGFAMVRSVITVVMNPIVH